MFNKGDKVRCIRADSNGVLTQGNIYEVFDVHENEGSVILKEFINRGPMMMVRFEKIDTDKFSIAFTPKELIYDTQIKMIEASCAPGSVFEERVNLFSHDVRVAGGEVLDIKILHGKEGYKAAIVYKKVVTE